MKAKRNAYLENGTNAIKKKQKAVTNGVAPAPEEKKEQNDCGNGVCSISWKPAAVAR